MERATSIEARQQDLIADDMAPGPETAGATEDLARDAGSDASPGTTIEPSDCFARHLAETSGAMFMYSSMAGVFREGDALAYKKYRDQLLIDCGSPSDPIEIMLIEQLALAHLNAGRLHFRAAHAESLDGARVYGGLAVLLQGELRRTALALKAYRATARPHGVLAEDESDVKNGPAKTQAPGSQQKSRRRRTG